MSRRPQVASFRDPLGRVVVLPDRVVRVVKPEARATLERFLVGPTATRAMVEGQLVGTRPLEGEVSEVVEPFPGLHDALALGDANGEAPLLLEHDRVPFVSYPYEWAPEMLEAAGHLTLDLHDGLVGEGLGLKDATPYNVLFDGPRPVFIDVLSVEERDPGDPVWTPYSQFVRTFLLPLLAQRDLGVPLAETFLAERDGLAPERVYRMTPPMRRLRPSYLGLVSMPTWLSSRAEAIGDRLYDPKRLDDAEKARFILDAASKRLRRRLRRIAPDGTERSHWSDYMGNRQHYKDDDAARKERFVRSALGDQRPEWVLDVGCNTGHFSRMAAQEGARVVAVDLDPVSVGRVWQSARGEGLDILPLVVNVSRPSPAVGWRNAECPSFLERAAGRFDMVLMLAVMHHLHVSERVPIQEIVDLAASLSRRHVVFEYVGPDDEMFRHLLRGRGHLHRDLTRASFEAAARRRFDIRAAEPLADADRVLYLLERRPDDEPPAPAGLVTPVGREHAAQAWADGGAEEARVEA